MMEKEWISVNDKLPQLNGQYSGRILLYGNRNGTIGTHTGIYTATKQFFSYGENVSVTHWMPIPNPPKQENK